MTRYWQRRNLLRAVTILLFVGSASFPCLYGIEKSVVGQEAQLIVVGTFERSSTFPWFDGWHMTGTINVGEILYGSPIARQITMRFVCEWRSCRWWPPPKFPSQFLVRGIWFLKRVDGNVWEPSLDVGFRTLSERSYWEAYIRQYKH